MQGYITFGNVDESSIENLFILLSFEGLPQDYRVVWDTKPVKISFHRSVQVIDTLLESGRKPDATSVIKKAIDASGSTQGSCNKTLRDRLRSKLIDILMTIQQYQAALEVIKPLSAKYPYSIKIWNQYCFVIGRLGTVKWYASVQN